MKQPLLRAREVLEMAIQIEHHGIAFYQACLQSPAHREIKDVFNFLVDQEQDHVLIFTAMKNDVADDELPEDYPGEMRGYINSFVKTEVFDSPAGASLKASELESPMAVIDFAIHFEKRTIRFYEEIRPRLRSSEAEKLNQVIAEEYDHTRELNDLQGKLTE